MVLSQEVPVTSGDIINQTVAHVTQEVTSQLAPELHSTSQPPSHHGRLESSVPQVSQQNTVFTLPLSTVANVHPAAAAPVQPLSLAPTQLISSFFWILFGYVLLLLHPYCTRKKNRALADTFL